MKETMTEDQETSYPSSIRMLTAKSSSIELYQELCKVIAELEDYRSMVENLIKSKHYFVLRSDSAERELNVCHEALLYISSLDTSQDASPDQCSAVLVAMDALEDKKYFENEKNLTSS